MLTNILLQGLNVASDTAEAVQQQGSKANDDLSLMDLILAGGWVMIPLFILSIVAVYIFIERLMTISKSAKDPSHFFDNVKSEVLKGNIDSALQQCSTVNSPLARMIEKGLQRIGGPMKNIEVAVENVGKIEINRLEKNLSTLATISGAAPMIGFLGTVIGMIRAFIAIAQVEGNVSPSLLSKGIYEAMVTTATGLIVGIMAYIAYNILTSLVQKIIYKLEYRSIEFIDLLQEPTE